MKAVDMIYALKSAPETKTANFPLLCRHNDGAGCSVPTMHRAHTHEGQKLCGKRATAASFLGRDGPSRAEDGEAATLQAERDAGGQVSFGSLLPESHPAARPHATAVSSLKESPGTTEH